MNDLDRVEAQAFRDVVTLAGGRAETVGGVLCLRHDEAPSRLNWSIPIGAIADVDAVLAWYDGAPHVMSTELDLEPYGYERTLAWMKFERDDAPAPPVDTDLRIEETFDGELFGRVLAAGVEQSEAPVGFAGAPGWACFLAWDGDEPVSCAALYADGGDAWLGVAATRPDARGRGAQRALLSARIDTARAAGAKRLVTETGERLPGQPDQSYRNILRAGFEERYVRPNWKKA